MIYPLKYRFWRINLLLDLILALPTRRFLIMEITKNSIIGDVLDKYPETAEAFFSIGMHCLGCPASRGETIEEACMVHGANADELIDVLNQIANK
jgi:hybrid cluster-associated redox disulfide protein